MSTAQPFTIDISSKLLDWIREIVETCHLVPDVIRPANEDSWVDGVPTSEMDRLVTYWKEEFDWRSVERRLNETFQMFIIDLDEAGELIHLHFVHHRSKRAGAMLFLSKMCPSLLVKYRVNVEKP